MLPRRIITSPGTANSRRARRFRTITLQQPFHLSTILILFIRNGTYGQCFLTLRPSLPADGTRRLRREMLPSGFAIKAARCLL